MYNNPPKIETSVPKFQSTCTDHTLFTVNNNVYLIGGDDGQTCLKFVTRIQVDDAAPSWETMQEIVVEQNSCAVTIHKNTKFVFGRYDGENTLSCVKYFHTTTHEGWIAVENEMELYEICMML